MNEKELDDILYMKNIGMSNSEIKNKILRNDSNNTYWSNKGEFQKEYEEIQSWNLFPDQGEADTFGGELFRLFWRLYRDFNNNENMNTFEHYENIDYGDEDDEDIDEEEFRIISEFVLDILYVANKLAPSSDMFNSIVDYISTAKENYINLTEGYSNIEKQLEIMGNHVVEWVYNNKDNANFNESYSSREWDNEWYHDDFDVYEFIKYELK